MYWARSRILEYLSKIQGNLPEGVTPSLGPDATGIGWVYEYALVDKSGRHDLAELRSFQDWYLRYWLEAVPGVAEVASVGGFEKQYQITVDPDKLLAYHLTLKKIIERVRRSNNDVGGRVLELSGREYFIRGRGYVKNLRDIEEIGLGADARGTPVYLRDVATVAYGPDSRRGAADLNGEGEVVGGVVVMRYGENALKVIGRVKDKLRDLATALPAGVELVPVYDRSGVIQKSIRTLTHTLAEEGLVVALVIVVFLWQWRGSLVAIITLPVAVLLAFVAMHALGLSSNIMSLGGIAIAIGAMVDAAIVLVENVDKKMEQYRDSPRTRLDILLEATREVGKPIFFSLMVITASFLPIFTLEAQEGRLFKPLAFTKTFAMFFAGVVSVTLAPALLSLLSRREVRPETANPLNRGLIALYRPLAQWFLNHRRAALLGALGLLAVTVPLYLRLGSEFMPPLNEGSILYMPTTLPGIAIEEGKRILQAQDKILKSFPEVASVFGKIGRARTATDPAPLSMIETTIMLKDKREWRPGMTWDKLIREMNRAMNFPGWTNAWTMPIKGRTDMLTTGIRTPVGIKLYGPDLQVIEGLGKRLERILQDVKGTRSVYAERVTGGYYLDFTPRREVLARYDLTVADVEHMVETAVGGMNIATTIEGPERYAVNVRYPRELRDSLDKLRRVYVPLPNGAQVPMEELADLRVKTGPPMLKDENGALTGWVYVDLGGRDIGGYVAEAKRKVAQELNLPTGYHLEWTGQYEFMQRVQRKLVLVIPLTLLLIAFLIYMNFKSVPETMIILLSVPFALVGGIWLLSLLGYNLSIAVWVGIIALAGVAAETGIVMLVYLNESYARHRRENRLRNPRELQQAVMEGSVLRVRPLIMTVSTTIIGLMPLMWSSGTGADVMKRIAAPMVGGLVTAVVLTLLLIPVLYSVWRERQLWPSRIAGTLAAKPSGGRKTRGREKGQM